MSLDAIPAKARVLIDANIFIYAKRGRSAECRRMLERCAQRDVIGILTTITVAESSHRRMMQEAQSRGLTGSNPARALAQNPAWVRQLVQYSEEVKDLLSGDLTVLVVESSDFAKATELQRTHGLLTNDSLNLAVGLRGGVEVLATADSQFDQIAEIAVFKPEDI